MSLPTDADPFVLLFSESTGRVLVSVAPDRVTELETLADQAGIPLTPLGEVGSAGPDATLEVSGQFTLPLSTIRAAWQATLPAAVGR